MRWVLIFAGLLLSSCNPVASDGYVFEKKEFDRKQFATVIVVHPSLKELRESGPRVEGRDLMAYGILSKGKCEIHIVDPEVSYEPKWMGHELAHCIYGRWHEQ
jgi:hypothetical protein